MIPYYIIIVYVYPYYHTVSSDHWIPYLIKDKPGAGAAALLLFRCAAAILQAAALLLFPVTAAGLPWTMSSSREQAVLTGAVTIR